MNAWRPTLYAYSLCQSSTFPVSRGLTADRRIGIASWSFLIRLPSACFSAATPAPPAGTDRTPHRVPVSDRAQIGRTSLGLALGTRRCGTSAAPQMTIRNLQRLSAACTECVPGQPSTYRPGVSGLPPGHAYDLRKGQAAGQRVDLALLCKQGVGGSSPLVSTIKPAGQWPSVFHRRLLRRRRQEPGMAGMTCRNGSDGWL